MRISIVINDETIMDDIREAMDELDLEFATDEERKEFEDDCFDEIASKMECYEDYYPTLERVRSTVEDLADDRGLFE